MTTNQMPNLNPPKKQNILLWAAGVWAWIGLILFICGLFYSLIMSFIHGPQMLLIGAIGFAVFFWNYFLIPAGCIYLVGRFIQFLSSNS